MKDLTDKEYDALDEYYTKNTVMPSGKPGLFARRKWARAVVLDDLSSKYLTTKAMAEHTTPAQIISGLVRNLLTSTSSGTSVEQMARA
jgi:hypothetical protein